jgi:hypothetical protein
LGEKLRGFRGILCGKVKTAMSEVFGNNLPPIKSSSKLQVILNWKQLPSVKSCYKKIFDKSDFPGNPTYMEAILKKVWPSTSLKPPEQHVAWAISIVQTILNPKNCDLKITEDIIKYLLSNNLVSIYNFTFKNISKIY